MKIRVLKAAESELDELPNGVKGRMLGLLEDIVLGKDLPKQKSKVNKQLWEARLPLDGQQYRLLYSVEKIQDREGAGSGAASSKSDAKVAVLLGLIAFQKKTRNTPKPAIKLAERRLSAWRIAQSKGQE